MGSLVLKLVCGISGRSRAIEVVLRQKRAWLIDCEGSIAKFVPLRKCAMGSGRAEVHADHRDQSVQNWPELLKITSMRRASAIRGPRLSARERGGLSLWLPDEAKIETEQEEYEMDDGAPTADLRCFDKTCPQ